MKQQLINQFIKKIKVYEEETQYFVSAIIIEDNSRVKKIQEIIQICNDEKRWGEIIHDPYIEVFGKIVAVVKPNEYNGCYDWNCKGKADPVAGDSTKFKCQRCHRVDQRIKRFVLELSLKDNGFSVTIKMFDDEAIRFLGITADEKKQMSYREWQKLIKERISACPKQSFKVKAQIDRYFKKKEIELIVKDFDF